MLNCRRSLAVALVCWSALRLADPPSVSAQLASGSTVTCESDGSLVRCAAGRAWKGARLVKQLSRTPCLQGENWGFDRRGIWVHYGCRGVFEAGDAFASLGERVTCASASGGRAECPAATRFGVQLIQQISNAPCEEGRTWGTTERSIWVDRGCRGEFQVGNRPPPSRRIACGTRTGRQVNCDAGGRIASVRLARDLSGGRCREGYSWGSSESFIWVTRHCQGEFDVGFRSRPSTPGAETRLLVCGSASGRRVTCETEGDAMSVRLLRDLSEGRCARESSWGHTDEFIWTTDGCRGEFQIVFRARLERR